MDLVDGGSDLLGPSHIQCQRRDFQPVLTQAFGGFGRMGRLATREQEVAPRFGQLATGFEADAARGASDSAMRGIGRFGLMDVRSKKMERQHDTVAREACSPLCVQHFVSASTLSLAIWPWWHVHTLIMIRPHDTVHVSETQDVRNQWTAAYAVMASRPSSIAPTRAV